MPEIVEVTTSDGVRLHGALHAPSGPMEDSVPLDAVLVLHGAGGNFYGSTLFAGLLPGWARLGIAVLSVNTRGHDSVSTAATASGPRLLGAAFEIVDECRYDVAAWIDWLSSRGYQRLAIAGHSLGAVKAVYALAHAAQRQVQALVAISPPRLSHSRFVAGPEAEQFLNEFAEAERHVAAGHGEKLMSVRFPIPYLVTAAGYIDKYGREERYNILDYVPRISCPMLFTFGTIELRRGSAFQGLPEDLQALAERGADLKVAVLAGADHFYTAARNELAGQIATWLRRFASKP